LIGINHGVEKRRNFQGFAFKKLDLIRCLAEKLHFVLIFSLLFENKRLAKISLFRRNNRIAIVNNIA
jgi:hypothetical protein